MKARGKLSTVIAVMAILGIYPCYGRLGDTMDQCVARWGAASESDAPKAAAAVTSATFKRFSKDGYGFVVGFMNGVVGYEWIDKTGPLTSDDVAAILNAESGDSQWSIIVNDPDLGGWERADGALAAYYHSDQSSTYMTLYTKEFKDAMVAAKNKQPF